MTRGIGWVTKVDQKRGQKSNSKKSIKKITQFPIHIILKKNIKAILTLLFTL